MHYPAIYGMLDSKSGREPKRGRSIRFSKAPSRSSSGLCAFRLCCVMALIYGLNRVIMESRRNNGLYDDEIDEDEEEEDDGEYED